jgi:hypothetical protein
MIVLELDLYNVNMLLGLGYTVGYSLNTQLFSLIS